MWLEVILGVREAVLVLVTVNVRVIETVAVGVEERDGPAVGELVEVWVRDVVAVAEGVTEAVGKEVAVNVSVGE